MEIARNGALVPRKIRRLNKLGGIVIYTVQKQKGLLLCLFAALCALALGNAPAYAAGDALYDMEEINQYSQYFTNHVDGYRLMVQRSMEADMSCASVRTVLSNAANTIEIYDQKLGGGESFASYRYYGNRFIGEYPSYRVAYDGWMTIAGRQAYVLEWSRPALKNVPNDKCWYASVDMQISGDRALTFLFKSAKPFEQFGSKYYILVLETLTLEDKTAQPIDRRTEAAPNPVWNEETRALYDAWFSPESGLVWGIYEPGAPRWDVEKLYVLEKGLDHRFPLLLEYSGFPSCDVEAVRETLDHAAKDGRTVELTLQTDPDEAGNVLMDTLNGQYDELLNAYARTVAESEKPVLFRLCNEMNGDWCVYSAYHTSKDTDLYKAFYRYVYGVFAKNGALANTIWVWNPNERSFPNFDWNHALCYYPGDEYVDVVGLTGYNTGTYYPGERWRGFGEIYDALYRTYADHFAQPLMITEFSCSSFGGDKAAWVREMLGAIGAYDRIKAAVWWDGCDWDGEGNIARSYFIDDDPGVLDAFRAYFAQ